MGEEEGDFEAFLERLILRLHDLHRRGIKADVLILMGRQDKLTGQPLPWEKTVQVREFAL